MFVSLLLLLLGLALIVYGADWLVDGASGIARKAGISEFVIGLTIVGFGTSCPELVVSLTGAIQGNADISVGNVLGSNIFNTLMILGVTGVIAPVAVTETNRRMDIPVTLLITFLFIICGMGYSLSGLGQEDRLSRAEGIVFLVIFFAYMYFCFKLGKTEKGEDDTLLSDRKRKNSFKFVLFVTAGLAGLVIGGRFFVNSATEIARILGVSDKFIAITILAGGTSLPELATCVAAAVKGKGQLALGNILGSNVFNILLILGVSSVVTPLSFKSITIVDAGVLLLGTVLLWMSTYTGHRDRIDRWEGAVLLAFYAGYMGWLVINV